MSEQRIVVKVSADGKIVVENPGGKDINISAIEDLQKNLGTLEKTYTTCDKEEEQIADPYRQHIVN